MKAVSVKRGREETTERRSHKVHLQHFKRYLEGPSEGRNKDVIKKKWLDMFLKYAFYVETKSGGVDTTVEDLLKSKHVNGFVPEIYGGGGPSAVDSSLASRNETFSDLLSKVLCY